MCLWKSSSFVVLPEQLFIFRCFVCQLFIVKSFSQRDFKGSLSHLDEVPFFHRDSAFHLDLSKSNYEVMRRFILTLFEGSKIIDGSHAQDPEIVVMENIFHLLPGLNRIGWKSFLPEFFLFFKIWMILPVCPRSIPVIVGKGVDSPSTSSTPCWRREGIGIHPSGSVRQHGWCLRQKCQELIMWGHLLWNRWRF
ncbi:unnamed protein product [Prunus brigantina]